MKIRDLFVNDRNIGIGIGCVTVCLLLVWPFDGVHPSAWNDLSVAAGLLPQAQLLPGMGTYFAHLLFKLLPYGTALFLIGLLTKLAVGACGALAYGAFVRMADIATSSGSRDIRRRRISSRIAAGVASFAFTCSEPMWMIAQGQVGLAFLILLAVLSIWLFTRVLVRPSFSTAVAVLATLGVVCAETPFGWLMLAVFVHLAVRFVAGTKDESWLEFLEPIQMQKTKWSMTFAFLGVFLLGVLVEVCAFAWLDGLRAGGITAGELPLAYVQAYVRLVTSSCSLTGLCLLVFAVIVPFALTFLLIRPATDEEQYLSFKHTVVYFVCGLISFLQLSPYTSAWFWNQGAAATVSTSLLPFTMLLCAIVLAWSLFVLCVEVLCRDYVHIETVLYQGFHDDDSGVKAPLPTSESVRLTSGRLMALVVPLVLVALIAWGRRLPDDRYLQSLICAFVDETVEEASEAKYLFTDGAFDALIRLEARRRGVTVRPVSMMSGRTHRDAYVRQLGVQGLEDRLTLATGAAEALHTWVVSKPERSSELAVQLAFEYFRRNRRLKPVVYGLLVRPSGGDEAAAAASVKRCHDLADRIVAAHESGVWRHARDRRLKDRLLFAQFRLAVISRLRAVNLDAARQVKESIDEIAYADRLNACNPSLAKIARRTDWIRRQNGEDLTPREGLEVAMKRLDFNMARRYAHPILKEDPDEPNANFAIGMGFYSEEQYAKAEEYLKRVLKRSPNEPAVFNNLALICLKTGRLEEAEKHVLKAVELRPDQPEIKDTQSRIQTAMKRHTSPQVVAARRESSVRVEPERVGVCSWSWQKPVREVAAEMEKAGVKGLHLALGPFVAPDARHGAAEGAEALAFVKEKVFSGEWTLMSTMVGMVGEDYSTLETIRKTGGIVPDETWEANQKIVTEGARLTQELRCRYMSTHAGFLDESDPVAFAKYVERVRWMRDECAKYGVTLILESGQETAESLAKFMTRVPGVGINFDPANMILYAKGDPTKALRTLLPWIRQVHVKDACVTKEPGTWGREVPWGAGEVGGKEFLARLAALGYKGNFVVEREDGADRAGDIRRAIDGLVK